MMRKFLWVLIILAVFISTSAFLVAIASSNTTKEVVYGDTLKLYFDERDWTLGADNATTNVYYEYVTDGQNVNNWKELVTLQMYKGLQNKITAEEFAKRYIGGLYQSCGDKLTVSVIRNNSSDYMVEWKVNGHPQFDNQHEVDRIIAGKESLIVLHYVMKTSTLTPANRAKWVEILDKATLK